MQEIIIRQTIKKDLNGGHARQQISFEGTKSEEARDRKKKWTFTLVTVWVRPITMIILSRDFRQQKEEDDRVAIPRWWS